jgi:ABC-type transport system involved in multi-copper enzyme maturation permease subunit
MIRDIYTIAAASFKEAYKKKIFSLLGLLTLIYLIIFSAIIYIGVKSYKSQGLDSISVFVNVAGMESVLGLYFSSMLVAFLSIMLSVGVISLEMENSTIYTVVSKPIKRSSYVLGKFTGNAVLLIMYSALLYCAVIIIPMAVNVSFAGSIGISSLARGLLYFVLEPIAILALCLYGSVRFKTLSNGIFVIAIYILGLIGGIMEQIGLLIKSDTLFKLGIISGLISPFDCIYRKMMSAIFSSSGFLSLQSRVSLLTGAQTSPSIWMMAYALLFLLICVISAVRRFERLDL